jgi:putative serine protease PepD
MVTVLSAGGDLVPVENGVIIQADGVILTNAHPLGSATPAALSVVLPSGEQLPATVIGIDAVSDLAVLKVERAQLPAMPLAWGEPLSIGEPVVALGSPLNEQSTVSGGIISALNRNVAAGTASGGITTLQDSLQLDVPLTDALSGAAVVNCDGQLIGLGTAVPVPANVDVAAWSAAVGYAVPSTIARRISQELLATGKATHPWTGLSLTQVSADIAVRHDGQPGLFVQATNAHGPAATAGLAAGDLITALNGEAATSASYSRLLLTATVGDSVSVSYLRDGQTHQATVAITEQSAG